MKSSGENASISGTIIISICFSLWSLISRVVGDDKKLFEEEWQAVEFDRAELCRWECDSNPYYIEIPLINIRFLFRLLWRVLEISNRIFVCTLLWINIGGFGLIIIIGIEFMWCLILCITAKTYVKIYILCFCFS